MSGIQSPGSHVLLCKTGLLCHLRAYRRYEYHKVVLIGHVPA